MNSPLDVDLDEHYRLGLERDRLTSGQGILERERTRFLLAGRLPAAPADIVDVGGGAGVHARWLADQGHRVTMFDRYPLHVEQARAESDAGVGFAVEEADARELPLPDHSADAVVMLGPLYHLVERSERISALAEARRVLRPGGVLAAAVISRHASFLDGVFRRLLEQPGYPEVVDRGQRTGHHEPPVGSGWFTRTYFHRPDELAAELTEAGFVDVDVRGIEGPAGWAHDLDQRRKDPAAWEQVMAAAERAERDPDLIGLSAHLLGFGTAGRTL